MLTLTYLKSKVLYEVVFSRVSTHVIQILGDLPFKDSGFYLSRPDKEDMWDYSNYTTLYREIENGIQFSDDGSVYVEPIQPPEPEPYIPTLEELKEKKISEMELIQEGIIASGVDVVLADGTKEHFSLSEKEQNRLAVLKGEAVAGNNKIPWHSSDENEHCKYYSGSDMLKITTTAFEYVSYHVTYLRDLSIYIRSLTTKDDVEVVYYGIQIPEKYRSQPLDDMLTAML